MIPLILASIPPAIQQPEATSSTVTTIQNPIKFELAQATAQPSGTQLQEPLPKRYPYASIQAGIGFPNNLNGTFPLTGLPVALPPVQVNLNLNTGFNGELAVGYKFPDFRTDLSLGYSNFSSVSQTTTVTNVAGAKLSNSQAGQGSVDLLTVMANAYYDFKIKNQNGTLSRWSPYIGAGIGWGNLSTPSCATPGCQSFSGGSASTFAYQGKVGISYRATNSGFVFLEGGYLGTTGSTVSTVSYDPFGTWRLNLGWRQRL